MSNTVHSIHSLFFLKPNHDHVLNLTKLGPHYRGPLCRSLVRCSGNVVLRALTCHFGVTGNRRVQWFRYEDVLKPAPVVTF